MRCYFCNGVEKIIPQKRTLWNGTEKFQCVFCFQSMEEGLKIVQGRGVYDPQRIPLEIPRGGDRMNLKKVTIGNRLKAEFIETRQITTLKILDSGEMVTFSSKEKPEDTSTKPVFTVEYEGMKTGDPTKWAINGKSQNVLIEKWGENTDVWIGKNAEINLAGEGEFRHIMVDSVRTK